MITQATDELDLFGNAFAGFEYLPYLLLAGLPLCLLYLGLRRRRTAPLPIARVESETSVQQAAAAARRTRYVDADARSFHAPRVQERREDIFDHFPAATSTLVDERDAENVESGSEERPSSPNSGKRAVHPLDDELNEDRAVGWGVVVVGAVLLGVLFVTGWWFPGVESMQGFTAAGWWAIAILVAAALPAIIRKSLREKNLVDRVSLAATWLLVTGAAMALVVAAVGLGLSTPGFRVWFEKPGEPQPTAVTTETIVPSSITFKSGSFIGFFLGGTSAEISGVVETDDGVRTFSTSRYRYGDDWQLKTEETCTTTTYTSPLVIQDDVDEEQCFTSTIAILGDEIPTN